MKYSITDIIVSCSPNKNKTEVVVFGNPEPLRMDTLGLFACNIQSYVEHKRCF